MPPGPLAGGCSFALIELLVTTAIASVLMFAASPTKTGMRDSQRRISSVNSLLSSLHMARSEAIKRNGWAVASKSASGDPCAVGGGWTVRNMPTDCDRTWIQPFGGVRTGVGAAQSDRIASA